jgi:hypothetical protein
MNTTFELCIIDTYPRRISLSEEPIRNEAKQFGIESIEWANAWNKLESLKEKRNYKEAFPILVECLLIFDKLHQEEIMKNVLDAFVWLQIQNENSMDDEYDSQQEEEEQQQPIIPSLKIFSLIIQNYCWKNITTTK